jgi:flagellar protein FlaG
MSEFSMQTHLNAKPSAPERQTGKMNVSGESKTSPSASQAEVSQAEKVQTVDVSSAMDKKETAKETNEQVEKAVAQLNDYVQNTQRKLEFQMDEESGKTVIRVYDKVSEELIRQMPNEEALELAQRLSQEEPLMLFSAQV